MAGDHAASRCSFCSKRATQVRYLITGQHGVCICDACVLLASDLLAQAPRPPVLDASVRRPWWRHWRT